MVNQGSNTGAGGDHFSDSSGVLKYVLVQPRSRSFGYGTVLSHIQVSHALSDAIVLEGGTADFSHLVFNSVYESDLMTDKGYTGNIQFLMSQKPDELLSDHQWQPNNDGYSVNLTERDWGARYTNVKIANARSGQWVNNYDYSHDRP